jgi:hypothetical protein
MNLPDFHTFHSTDLAECFRTEAQCEDGQEVSFIQKGSVLRWVLVSE